MWFKTKKEKVKCEQCKHYIDIFDAQEIKFFYDFISPYKIWFYCPLHRKPFDEVYSILFGGNYYKKKMDVNEQGEPIGYIKKKVVN